MKPRILSVDTTSECGGVALLSGAELVGQTDIQSADGFGHLLFGEIERLLAAHGWALDSVDCFAAAAGPGSFTGIRVGLAAVKGLGEALERPVVAVSNLQAVAWYGSAPLRAALIDARRGEVYAALYSASLQSVLPETVTNLHSWLPALPGAGVELLSTSTALIASAIESTPYRHLPLKQVPRALAVAAGSIAANHLAGGLALSPAALDANYVRRSDAELFWKDR
jgi:tRNA threonylcarbamoyladenosine biosynthesis protein TsaB